MSPSRRQTVALWSLVGLYLAAVAVASIRPGPSTWGFDMPGYLDSPARWLVILAAGFGVALLVLGTLRPGTAAVERDTPLPPSLRLLLWFLLPVYGAALWFLRTRTYLLGDQQMWMDVFRAHEHRYYSEPLSAVIWYGYVRLLEVARVGVTPDALAALPALCGMAAAVLLWKIAGRLVRPGSSRAIPFLLLLTLGTIQLYCGYIESYPIASVAMLAFIWLGLLQLEGRCTGLWVTLAFGIAVAAHFVAIYLAPAYAYLVLRGAKRPLTRLVMAIVPLGLALAALVIAHPPRAVVTRPIDTVWLALQVAARPGAAWHAILGPARDLLNTLLLILPIPLFLILAQAVGRTTAAPSTNDTARPFLAIMALCGFLLAAVLVIPGSPAQDWDLMSLLLLPMALLPLSGARFGPPLVAGGLVALAAAASTAFVLVNADPIGGLLRFRTIVAPEARLSEHERGYGNEKLMMMYIARGDGEAALEYARRALDSDVRNPRYLTNVGLAYYRLGRYGEAIPFLEEAVRRDPTRWPARFDLGLSYLSLERYGDAAEHLGYAARHGADRPDVFHSFGIALFRSGRQDSALTVWKNILVRWPEYADHLRSQTLSTDGVMEAPAR